MSGRRKSSGDGIGWGLGLIVLGIVFLLAQRDLIPREWLYNWWTWWPAILILVGLAKLIRPSGPSDIGSGVTTTLFGFWFFANLHDWYGLHWGNSWPLALVAVGAGMMAKAIAIGVMRGDGKEAPRD